MAGKQGERKPGGKQAKLQPSRKQFKRRPSVKPKAALLKSQEKPYAEDQALPNPPGLYSPHYQGYQSQGYPRFPRPGPLPHGSPQDYQPPYSVQYQGYPPQEYPSQGYPRFPRPGPLPHGIPQDGGSYYQPPNPPQYQGYPPQEYPSQGYPGPGPLSYPPPLQYGGPYDPPPLPPQYPPPQQGGRYRPYPVYPQQGYPPPQRGWSRIRQLVRGVGEGVVTRVAEDIASQWISDQVAPSDWGDFDF